VLTEKYQVITLPGWSFSHKALKSIWPDATCFTIEDLFSDSVTPNLHKISSALNSVNTTKDKLIIGWSLGGMIALDYCLKENDEKIKLILLSSTSNFVIGNELNLASFESLNNNLILNRDKALSRFFGNLIDKNHTNKDKIKLINEYLGEIKSFKTSSLINGLMYLKQSDLSREISALKNQCLLIHGGNDQLIPFSHSINLNKMIQDSALINIENGTHMLPYENQSEITSIIEKHEFFTS
jgi:pimeloyl-ACP methyl ester carboxylesterase